MLKHQTFNPEHNRIVIVCVKRFCKATRMEVSMSNLFLLSWSVLCLCRKHGGL